MSVIKATASRSNLLFIMAVVLGLYLPGAGALAHILVLPALAVALGVTLLRFPAGYVKKPGELLAGTLWGILMNYLVLGNLIILGGLFLIQDEKFWEGLVLLAAVPPAAVVLSLGEKIKSAKGLIMAGFAGTYAGALILIPLIGIAFLKFLPVHYDRLIILPFGLIILPLLISRFLVDQNLDEWARKHERIIADICFFIVFYALAAGNTQLIRQWPEDIVAMAAIACGASVIPTLFLLITGRLYKLSYAGVSSLMLLATMKNCGLAGGIAIYVFNNEAGVPALVFAVFMFLNILWLKFRGIYHQWRQPADEAETAEGI